MSNLKLTTLVTAIERLVKNSDENVPTTIEQRVEIVSNLIGTVLGLWISLPATVTTNRDIYYVTTIYPQAVNVINVLIESFQFDVEKALDACKLYWCYRYDLVHNNNADVSTMLNNLLYIVSRTGTEHDIETHLNLSRLVSGSDKENFAVAISNLRNYLTEEGVLS